MERARRIRRKNKLATTTSLLSFSLAPLRCMKNRATRMALKVAIVKATAALKRPRSREAAQTVRPVHASSVIQMPKYSLSDDDGCAEMRASGMSVNQVEQWEQVDPNDVHEMQIQPPHFDGSVVRRSKSAFPGHHGQPNEDANPDDHMERVQAGHDEVESKEDLRMAGIGVLVGMPGNHNVVELEARAGHMMLLELFLVLDPFDSEERRAEHQGREQVANQQPAPAGLCCPDCEHYGQAAAD